jgi:abhydrolase domain-containing protein 5
MELEKKILMNSGLEVDKDLFISNIVIDYRGKNFIHTIKCGEDSNPNVIVMLHGYGGTGLFFYKLFKELSPHYKIYTIDHLGMGLSSRPDFDCQNLEETTDFFVESLEAWRQSVGLESFIVCGHSFGGYIAASYTRKYLKNVKGLILLSPLGFTKENTEWAYLEDDDYKKDLRFWEKFLLKKRLNFFKEKQTPSDLASSNWAWFFKLFIKKFWVKRLKLDKTVADDVWEYINEIFKIPNSSERCLHFIVNPNLVAYQPIEDMINDLNLPMTVLYGDQDWMNCRGATRVHSNNLHCNFIFEKVKDCGHQMVMENHLGLLEYFINKIDIVNAQVLEKLSI